MGSVTSDQDRHSPPAPAGRCGSTHLTSGRTPA
jgi:hypothetical protein